MGEDTAAHWFFNRIISNSIVPLQNGSRKKYTHTKPART